MKTFFLFISFIFFIPLNAQEYKNQTVDSIISWNANTLLSWNDFQGELQPNVYGSAMTIYSIDISPENVLVDENDMIQNYEELTCDAKFYKYLSWSVTNNKTILNHEQLHFDIAEVFARKLRAKFNELKILQEARFSIYMEAYETIWKNCRRFQMQYDKVTSHGINLEANRIWQQNIKKELEKSK